MDLAEIWFGKLSLEKRVLEAAVAEQLADVLFEIGRDQARKQLDKSALQWLDKGYDVLACQPPEELGSDASQVRSCIMHNTVRVLLKEHGEGNISRAWSIIHELEGQTSDTIVIWLLKLELFSIDQSAAQDYYEVLIRVVRQIQLSEMNMATVLHHVHELQRQNARLAHTVLAALLSERLLALEESDWIEKTIITIVWNCTTSRDLDDATDSLEKLLDTVAAKTHSGLGTSATHAAQVVCPCPPNPDCLRGKER